MKYTTLILCYIFLTTGNWYTNKINENTPKFQQEQSTKSYIIPYINSLQPCSKVADMPCEESVENPLKDALDSIYPTKKLFSIGEKITCMYPGVFSWSNKEEFIKTISVECKVIQATDELSYISPLYQHIKVNCLHSLKTKLSSHAGVGLVRKSPLNYVKRWFSSDDCYHFTQSN